LDQVLERYGRELNPETLSYLARLIGPREEAQN